MNDPSETASTDAYLTPDGVDPKRRPIAANASSTPSTTDASSTPSTTNASPTSSGTNASSTRWILTTAAVSAAAAVLIGAFGAHGLETRLAETSMDAERLTRRLAQFDTGARYHLVHSVAMFALAGVGGLSRRIRTVAASLMVAGVVLFSGSLYVLVLTDTPVLGAVTPLGGLAWIAAWITIAAGSLRNREP